MRNTTNKTRGYPVPPWERADDRYNQPADDRYDHPTERKIDRRLKTGHIDVKEMLKKEMLKSESTVCDKHVEKSRPCPDGVKGVSDSYIMFDSFEKTENSAPERGTLIFNVMVQGVTRDQTIGSKHVIETIIEMQINEFTIPLIATVPYVTNDPQTQSNLPRLVSNGGAPPTGAMGTPLTQLPYSDRMTVYIKEMDSQSYFGRNNTKYHFDMGCSLLVPQSGGSADRILVTPQKHGWDTYVFTDPIKSGEGFTFVFRNPDQEVKLPPDVLYGAGAQTDASQFLQFNFLAHGLAAGDRIHIRGFTTGNAVIDSYVRRAEGHIVGTGGLTANSFRLNPDVDVTPLGLAPNTPILPPPTVQPVDNTTPLQPSRRTDILIAKNRIRIGMRFRGVVGRLTNYMQP